MKNQRILIASTLALFLVSRTLFSADYSVDPAHSRVGFSIRHMVSKVKGEFKEFSGDFQFDPKKPDKTTGQFKVETNSINTNNQKRDEHLKSPDFFDVAKFPNLLYKVKKLTSSGGDKYKMEGDLTIHGVTKPTTFEVEYTGSQKDPWGNQRAGFSATSKIERKDFGIVWNKTLDSGGVLLGDQVEITLDVEAIEKAAEKKK